MLTQSSLCTGTWVVGFLGVGGGVVSHLHTEGDRGAVGTNSNGHPQGWPSALLTIRTSTAPGGLIAYQRDRLDSRRGSRGLASLTVKVRPPSSLPWSP